MRGLSFRKIKAGEGLVEKKKKEEEDRRERSIWPELEHDTEGETLARRSPAHKPHIFTVRVLSYRFIPVSYG